jgi:LPXTG-motif cell wall-anchored protein
VQDSSAPLTGSGSFTIPAPGAVALAGLAGLMGRRRR